MEDSKFIFVLDEWDYIFHQKFITEQDKEAYLGFLRNLLKDKPYVLLAYMTGILPIAKYSSDSELNMFTEFTMAGSWEFSDDFGFTEAEVDVLYERYLQSCENPMASIDGLREWYDGCHTASGERVYNPRSVVQALSFKHLGSYWTSSGPYDEISLLCGKEYGRCAGRSGIDGIWHSCDGKIQEYAATSTTLETKDEIFSAVWILEQ